jgi:PAS domain S-box-containing protein
MRRMVLIFLRILLVEAVVFIVLSIRISAIPAWDIVEVERALQEGRVEEALSLLLDPSLEKAPPDVRAYGLLGMGRCYLDLGLYPPAERSCEMLIRHLSADSNLPEREPLLGMGYFIKGEIFGRREMWGDAAEMFSQAASSFEHWIGKGNIDLGRLSAYLPRSERGYEGMEWMLHVSRERLADSLALQGKWEEASESLSRIPSRFAEAKMGWIELHTGSGLARVFPLVCAFFSIYLLLSFLPRSPSIAVPRAFAFLGVAAWQIGEFMRAGDPDPFSSARWWCLVLAGMLISGMMAMHISILAMEDRERRVFQGFRWWMTAVVGPLAVLTGLCAELGNPSSEIFIRGFSLSVPGDQIAHRILIFGMIALCGTWAISAIRLRSEELDIYWTFWLMAILTSPALMLISLSSISPSFSQLLVGGSGIAVSFSLISFDRAPSTAFRKILRFYLSSLPLFPAVLLLLLAWGWMAAGRFAISWGAFSELTITSLLLVSFIHLLKGYIDRAVGGRARMEDRHRITLMEFGRNAIGATSLEEIGEMLLLGAAGITNSEKGIFFLARGDGNRFIPTSLLGDVEKAKGMRISMNDDLIRWMGGIGRPLILSQFLRRFPATRLERSPALRAMFSMDLEIAVLVPALSGGSPMGILALGRPVTEETPSDEDLFDLLLLVLQGAMAMENVKLYGDIVDAKRRLEDTLASLLEGIVTFDRDGRITGVNRMAEKLLGSSANVLTGRTIQDIGLEIFPRPGYPKGHEVLRRVVERGDRFEDLRAKLRGREIVFRANISPLVDGSGRIKGVLLAIEDVTRREQLERDLRRAEKLSALGRISYALVHEIRNPLFAIRAAAQHLRSRPSLDPELDEFTSISLSEVDRVNDFIEHFLAYARPRNPRPRPFDLVGCVEMALMVYKQRMAEAGIEIERIYPEEHPWAFADMDLVREALLNVILNAIQAMEGGGRLTVSVANEGMGCRISIADTGVGIPKDDMDKIFEPFYTTKEGGIGIGLAIVKDIIEENGGRISVESDLGRGTTFHIRLPGARGIG